jgi:hypothetical protein
MRFCWFLVAFISFFGKEFRFFEVFFLFPDSGFIWPNLSKAVKCKNEAARMVGV